MMSGNAQYCTSALKVAPGGRTDDGKLEISGTNLKHKRTGPPGTVSPFRRVLVVEDEDTLRRVIVRNLTAAASP